MQQSPSTFGISHDMQQRAVEGSGNVSEQRMRRSSKVRFRKSRGFIMSECDSRDNYTNTILRFTSCVSMRRV
jgi:hypothetical protein